MKSLLRLILMLTLTAVVAACTDTCEENKNSLPRAGFYAAALGSEKITVDSLLVTGVGMKGDSALSEPTVPKNELYLPFRIDQDSTAYVFVNARKDGGQRDTVTFLYSRLPRLVSVECGVSYLFEMRAIRCQGVLIDSVTCPDGYIGNANKENLRIYFAVKTESE